ncbi:hypothetical protein [Luteimonas saliphila]|uniref:hypothetical protein n=1 Tax=Luteimonas saliphila TaxID=2804919 RepID=UPI00192D4D39|nr:hypothetical protein [Luteimonas saliphila]
MFEAPHYQGARSPPDRPDLAGAAETVCQVLQLNPFELVPGPSGPVERRVAIAHDCALVLLITRALVSHGLEVQ